MNTTAFSDEDWHEIISALHIQSVVSENDRLKEIVEDLLIQLGFREVDWIMHNLSPKRSERPRK